MITESKECKLQIGEFCCSLCFEKAEWAASVRRYYKGFLSEKEFDIHLDFEIIPHDYWIELPNSLILECIVHGNQFDFHSGLLKGFLDLTNKKACIKIKYGLLKNPRVFDQFLYHIYYTLLKDRYPTSNTNCLIHASGIVNDGKAYVFTGPSGSGKTTIASLVPEYDILNDEIIILGKDNGIFYASSTPFGQQLENRKNISAPLKAVFLIKHGKRNDIKQLKSTDFARFFIKEIVTPLPLLSTDRRGAFIEGIDFCKKVAQEVPCYEFYFVPDASFWEFIRENVK